MKFPKICHQIYFDFGKELSNEHKELVLHTRNYSFENDYEYILWDLNSATLFIKENYPYFYNFFIKKTGFQIVKCDFFRYLIMYHFGGIYVDLDFLLINPFENMFLKNKLIDEVFPMHKSNNVQIEDKNNLNIVLFEEWYKSANIDSEPLDKNSKGSLHNGCLLSLAEQPFWMRLCVSLSINIDNIKCNDDVWNLSATRKLRDEYMKTSIHENIAHCPYHVVCPFICQEKNQSQYIACKSINDIPLDLNKSNWKFFPLDEIKRLGIKNFQESIGVCVFLKAGSFWMN